MSSKTLFFDIETLPASVELEPVLQELYKRRPARARDFGEFLKGTSLNGNWGRILCIGIAQGDEDVQILHGDEPQILTAFWRQSLDIELFVGHNVLEFDLPFIYKRSIVHSVKPTVNIPMTRHQSAPVFDTMRQWDGWSSHYTGLHQLALILGLASSKQGIDGSQVYNFYQAGKIQEIYDYCSADVELTRSVYKRLTFNSQSLSDR